MATIVLLTSAQDIKDSGYVDENVDEKLIRAGILSAQDIYTRDIVGSGLFDQLKSQKQAGTLTVLNTTLLTYISSSLKYWTLWEGLAIFNYKIRNKAVMTSKSENSDYISASELARLGSYFKDRGEFYDERLVRYLMQNETDYPLYSTPGTGIDVTYPRRNSYSTGWLLDNRNDDYRMRGGPDSTIDL